jgi:uncharacterized protein YpbB
VCYAEARSHQNWQNGKNTIELASLAARNVLEEFSKVLRDKTLVGHRWVYVTKRNSKQEIRFNPVGGSRFQSKFGRLWKQLIHQLWIQVHFDFNSIYNPT